MATDATACTPLRRLREARGLRLEDVAAAAGVSIRTVFDAERGRGQLAEKRAELEQLEAELAVLDEALEENAPMVSGVSGAANARADLRVRARPICDAEA